MGKGKYVKVSSTKQQKEVIKWRRDHYLNAPESLVKVELGEGEGEEVCFSLGEDFSLLNIGGEENMAGYDIISFEEFYGNRDKIYAELYPDKFVIDNAADQISHGGFEENKERIAEWAPTPDYLKGLQFVACHYEAQTREVFAWRRKQGFVTPPDHFGFEYPCYFSIGSNYQYETSDAKLKEVVYDSITFERFKEVYIDAPHTGPYLGVTQDMLSGEVMPKYDHLEAPMDKAHEYFGNIQKVNVKQAEQDFEEVIKQTLAACKEVMISKGREYRRNNDPFHNFNQGAKLTGKTREEVIWGFALKHFISVQDIKADMLQGKMPTEALLNEKYGDLLNYLLIEKASIMSKIKGVK